jgi:hypothetical protein
MELKQERDGDKIVVTFITRIKSSDEKRLLLLTRMLLLASTIAEEEVCSFSDEFIIKKLAQADELGVK